MYGIGVYVCTFEESFLTFFYSWAYIMNDQKMKRELLDAL